MRLRHALAASAVTVVTAAVIAPLGAQPGSATPAPDPAPALGKAASAATAAPAADDPAGPPENQPPEPYCGDPESADFPIETRVHPGAKGYAPGGGGHTWKLDLRNTTKAACRGIHPVAVLVDRERRLTPGQVRLEYAAPGRGSWHPVALERTEHDETVGVFDTPDRQGFAVERGRTLTLRVRMRFAADAVDNRVELKVAAVQRRDDDGDWVGQSNGYSFRIGEPGKDAPEASAEPESTAEPGTGEKPAPAGSRAPGEAPDPSRGGEPEPSRTGGTDEVFRPPGGKEPSAPPHASRPPRLAETGTDPAAAVAGLSTAAGLIAVGSLLVRRSRRLGR